MGMRTLQELEQVWSVLPRKARLIDSPHEVGGRATDLEQIGMSLYSRLREFYPINGVPEDILTEVECLTKTLAAAELAIFELLVHVGEDVRYKR